MIKMVKTKRKVWGHFEDYSKSESKKIYEKKRNPNKRFRAYWGMGYYRKDKKAISPRIVDITFFSDANGYDPENLEQIDKLKIGEKWIAPTPETHTVLRIK